MKPILSICIPTYNRSEYLDKTIATITEIDEFKCGKIEIVVSDNCSTDTTRQIMSKYSGFENIIYNRNEQNILDKNFIRAIKLGHGLVRKLWNDTLIMNPNWARYVCSKLENISTSNSALFFTNKGKYEILSMDVDEFIDTERELVTWIGGFAVWENQCEILDEDGASLSLWQTVQIFKFLKKTSVVTVINGDMATINAVKKKNVSYGIYKVFYHNFIEIILRNQLLENIITIKTYEHVRRAMLYEFFSHMIIDLEMGDAYDGDLLYSSSETLKEDLHLKYCDEEYYDDFLRYLNWLRLEREKSWKRKIYKLYYRMRSLFV